MEDVPVAKRRQRYTSERPPDGILCGPDAKHKVREQQDRPASSQHKGGAEMIEPLTV
jgi:hypothetical protein